MAMAVRATVGEFDHQKESWLSYTERLEQYFLANVIDDEGKRKANLLSMCGPETYQLIRNLVAPDKAASRSYDELVRLVQEHHQPKPSVILQRFQFHTAVRNEGQSFAAFVARLRQLSEHCEFGDTLNAMLRDRLVCGCSSDQLQRQLLAKPPTLSFDEVYKAALSFEAAAKNAKHIQSSANSSTSHFPTSGVHALRSGKGGGTKSCYRCGENHDSATCRFKDAECRHCRKVGHIAKVCRSKLKQPQKLKPKEKSFTGKKTAPGGKLKAVLDNHTRLFKAELGCVQGTKARIYMDATAKPRFCAARSVPFAFREKVQEELNRLEWNGIIQAVQHSDWAAPIVPVLKRDGTVCICGDYKLTVNKAARLDSYPIPRIEDLLSMDLAHVYNQVQLDEDSR